MLAPLVMSVLATASAQSPRPSSPRAYGFVTATLSIHQGNGEAYHAPAGRVADNLSGTTWTLGGGEGVRLTPVLGLEAEVVFAGRVSAPQKFNYTVSEEYIANNRDFLVNAILRVHAGGPVQLVFGGGFAHTTAQHTSVVSIDSFFTRTSQPDGDPETYSSPTLTAGLDASFRTGAHAAIGPSFRVRWVPRPAGGEIGWNGIGPLAFQVGATVFLR